MRIFPLMVMSTVSNAQAEGVTTDKVQLEQDAIDEICGLTEEIYNAQKAMDREKAIGKVSGAVNLTRLNELGRMVVRRGEELVPLVNAYEKIHKEKPVLDGRCMFAQGFDKAEWDRLKKKAGKQKKNEMKKILPKK
jgi:hypothetical protein